MAARKRKGFIVLILRGVCPLWYRVSFLDFDDSLALDCFHNAKGEG